MPSLQWTCVVVGTDERLRLDGREVHRSIIEGESCSPAAAATDGAAVADAGSFPFRHASISISDAGNGQGRVYESIRIDSSVVDSGRFAPTAADISNLSGNGRCRPTQRC